MTSSEHHAQQQRADLAEFRLFVERAEGAQFSFISIPTAISRTVLDLADRAAPAEQASEEVLALHRQLAAETLRADQGWQRAEAKGKECGELRERLAEQASKQVPTIDTPEFRRLLNCYFDACNRQPYDEGQGNVAWEELLTHIDAKLKGQPAAPVAATEQTTEQTTEQQKECAPPFAAPASQHGAALAVLSAVRDGIPLQEPVNITGAVLAQREARTVLSGGTGPKACAMLVNIQLTPWKDGAETAEAFVSGYNTAMKWFRAALVDLADNATPLATPADAGAGLTDEVAQQVHHALELAMAICDAVPTRAHAISEDDPLRHIGRMVNYHESTGAHGYAVIRDAKEAFERELARLSTPAAPVTASQPAAQVPSIQPWHERTDECTPTATVMAMESEIADLRAALKGQPAAAHAGHDQKGGGNA